MENGFFYVEGGVVWIGKSCTRLYQITAVSKDGMVVLSGTRRIVVTLHGSRILNWR